MPTNESADAAYADHGAIKSLIDRKREEWSKGRESFTRAAYRNILFYRGHQWVRWDRVINRWRSARLPKNTPTPVTNIFASTIDALISVFARIEPLLSFRPGSPEEAADRATADVAGRAIHVVEDEVGLRLVRQILAGWVGLTGVAWLETGYDPDPIHGTRLLTSIDEAGMPVVEQVPIGRMYADVVPIFEMYFDPSVSDWYKQRACLREKSVSVEEAKARWPNLKDVIAPNVMIGGDTWYNETLPVLAPQIDENQTGRINQAGTLRPTNTKVTEQWYWQLPDETYPDGLLAVILSKQHVAYAGPLPYRAKTQDGSFRPFLPYVHFPQKLVPGSAFPKTVADDLALKQAQRNRWESIIEACGMRMGSPVWLKPNGANVTNLTGDPGNIISYNAVGPNAAKPERIQGQGVPLSFVQFIERIDASFEELAACLTGEQEVPCLDGRNRTMEELARDYANGGMWVYGYDRSQNRVVPTEVELAWRTGTKRCVRVSFKEGTHVDCSFDHPFLTWDRGYVWAERLRPDDAIVPLVLRPDRASGYQRVLQPADGFVEPVHKMVAREILSAGRGCVIHHRDEDKRNNLPSNLEAKTAAQHQRDHMAARSPQERGEIARKRWASLDESARERIVTAAVAGRDTPEWRQGNAARRRSWWAARTHDERAAHGTKMRAARANHRVLSVTEIGDRDVYDLQTSTHNFGTAAGVFVHNTFDVVKGARPEGVSAGIALQILQERSMSRYGPLFILWEQAWTEWARQALEIFREFATEPRLLKIKGRDGRWEVQKFLGSDLQGRVDVIPEAASSMPRSTLLDRAEMEQLAAMGIIDVRDPEVKWKFLEVYGRTNLTPSMARDTKNAIRENEAFEALAREPWALQASPADADALRQGDYFMAMQVLQMRRIDTTKFPKVKPMVDDHSIHAREIKAWLKSETAQALPEIIQVLAEKHAEFHQTLMIQQAQAMMGGVGPLEGGFTARGERGQPKKQNPLNVESGGDRMAGEQQEMAGTVAAGGY